jgi:hypothetical protein
LGVAQKFCGFPAHQVLDQMAERNLFENFEKVLSLKDGPECYKLSVGVFLFF